ncbi:MAG TPA: hypothetical protein VFK05_23735 [Polyangiaceae bacterium]|nr:hypothetical protein [Polyangiaceae bacterium]
MKLLELTLFSSVLLACSHKPANAPGPAQKAGAALDQGAHDAKETTKEAGRKLGEESDKAGEKLRDKHGD